jgi:hypothetical protein
MTSFPTPVLAQRPIMGNGSPWPVAFFAPPVCTLFPGFSPSGFAPICSDFVTNGCILRYLSTKNLDSAAHLSAPFGQDTSDLILELLFLLVSGAALSERILVRLAEAESAELDVWARDDYRISWLAVLYCANGRPTPWEWAFNRVVGGHASKVIPQLVARAREHVAMELPPKKAASSVREVETTLGEKAI